MDIMDRTAILKQLKKYLDELNKKYNGTPLSDRQIAIFKKRIASYDTYFRKVWEKNNTDPVAEPDRFLRLLEEVDLTAILIIGDALADLLEVQYQEPHQIPLTTYVPIKEPIDVSGKLKLSNIKVIKKGLNGHS